MGGLPAVQGGPRNAMPAAKIGDLHAALGLPEYADDLFPGESSALHFKFWVGLNLREKFHRYWYSSRGKVTQAGYGPDRGRSGV